MQGTPSISHIDRMQLYSIVFQIRYSPPLKLLQKDLEAHIVLRELSTLEEIDENVISEIEGYLCKTHASKNICKVSDSQTHASEEIWKNKTRKPFELSKKNSIVVK